MQRFTLEVQSLADTLQGVESIGFMRLMCKSKKEAADYYDAYNPHLRKLNDKGTWYSDWDPVTKRRYMVSEYKGEKMLLPPFNPKDEPDVSIDGHRFNFPTCWQRMKNYPPRSEVSAEGGHDHTV